jgi:hypothetical protein
MRKYLATILGIAVGIAAAVLVAAREDKGPPASNAGASTGEGGA